MGELDDELQKAKLRVLFVRAIGEMRKVYDEHDVALLFVGPRGGDEQTPNLRVPCTFVVAATVMRGSAREEVEIECVHHGDGRITFPVVAPTPPPVIERPAPTPEQIEAARRRDEEDDLIERARAKVAETKRANELAWAKRLLEGGSATPREPIPRPVKVAVWTRDGGVCQECGTNQLLQLDHIIPLALGGSNAIDNLQLLCDECNLRKSDQL